jgi:hypothetical protein
MSCLGLLASSGQRREKKNASECCEKHQKDAGSTWGESKAYIAVGLRLDYLLSTGLKF